MIRFENPSKEALNKATKRIFRDLSAADTISLAAVKEAFAHACGYLSYRALLAECNSPVEDESKTQKKDPKTSLEAEPVDYGTIDVWIKDFEEQSPDSLNNKGSIASMMLPDGSFLAVRSKHPGGSKATFALYHHGIHGEVLEELEDVPVKSGRQAVDRMRTFFNTKLKEGVTVDCIYHKSDNPRRVHHVMTSDWLSPETVVRAIEEHQHTETQDATYIVCAYDSIKKRRITRYGRFIYEQGEKPYVNIDNNPYTPPKRVNFEDFNCPEEIVMQILYPEKEGLLSINELCNVNGRQNTYLMLKYGEKMKELFCSFDHRLDEVAVEGDVIFTQEKDEFWGGDRSMSYQSYKVTDPTWEQVACFAADMMHVTRDKQHCYLEGVGPVKEQDGVKYVRFCMGS